VGGARVTAPERVSPRLMLPPTIPLGPTFHGLCWEQCPARRGFLTGASLYVPRFPWKPHLFLCYVKAWRTRMTNQAIDFAGKVREAYRRIKADIRRTPIERSEPLSRETGANVYIKWERDQITGSFKLRGALNKLRSLSEEDGGRGVVSASTGNHGLAISHAARREGLGLKLFLPETVAEVKKKRIEAMAVEVEVRGASCDKAEMIAREFADQTGRVFVSPYNDWDIVFGAGTVGLELNDDLSRFEDVLVPVGGGGPLAGERASAGSSPRHRPSWPRPSRRAVSSRSTRRKRSPTRSPVGSNPARSP